MSEYNQPIIVVKNPNSTNHKKVENDVLMPLLRAGYAFDTYDTQYPEAARNTAAMVQDLPHHATILSATGDGTSSQVTNAAVSGNKQWHIGYLPYGNFNDLAYAHMNRRQSVVDLMRAPIAHLHPLSIAVNGNHQRYVPGYITLGMTALIAEQYDNQTSRDTLRATRSRMGQLVQSLAQASTDYWQLKNAKLPNFQANGGLICTTATDIAIANTPIIAGIIRTAEPYYNTLYFGARTDLNMGSIWQATTFGTQALIGRTPLTSMQSLAIDFTAPVSVPIRTDGEPLANTGTTSIAIRKSPEISVAVLHAKC